MKVVIVDDEVYICKLVEHLIDWEGLGLELLGSFQSYEDVLEQFAAEPADILICDIEMPGKNGIELIRDIKARAPDCKCIVISGFRNFDYVHSAMQYGAVNYLLKPIDGEELNRVLRSVADSTREPASPESIIGERNTRTNFFRAIGSGIVEQDMMAANRKYHYQFRAGYFNTLRVSFTGISPLSEHLQPVMKRFDEAVRQKLADICYEVEIFHDNIVMESILINYDTANGKRMNFMLDQILNDALAEVGGISNARCITGVGMPVECVGEVKDSLKTARAAWCGCFTSPNKQVFYAQALGREAVDGSGYALSSERKQELRNIIEAVNPDAFEKWLSFSLKAEERLFHAKPSLIYDFTAQVVELFIAQMDDLHSPVLNKSELRGRFEILFYNTGSLAGLGTEFGKLISGEILLRLEDKQNNASLYVQQAKKYIERNYTGSVTLEAIAEKLHISPVYLSVVFKNETGMNYSKYLTQLRIEKSKELLKKPDMNLTQIANAVGYDSAYYFSTLFKKETMIKPTEYRRLHQHDIDG